MKEDEKIMEGEATTFRLNRIELDIADLKASDRIHTADLVAIEKSNIRTEVNTEKVLDSLKALTIDVTAIKEKPAKNYEAIKAIIVVIAVTNTVGILWSMFVIH